MTTDRQTLRAKHQPDENGYCKICANRNFDGSTSVREWPCDAIKVLDYLNVVIEDNEQAMEALKGTLEIAQRLAGNL